MTAVGLRVLTLAFPNPDVQPISSNDFTPVNASLSYSFSEQNQIRTLSTNSATPGHAIDGLLFTPTLPAGICPEVLPYIPPNATTASQLPADPDIFWVALAPWINANCTLEYLAVVQNSPAQAFLFYLLDNGTQIPPIPNSPVWALGDGGRWKSANPMPVYAVSSVTGQTIMSHLADYSGNVTDVPNGHVLANEWPSMDYIRLAVELNIEGGNKLPSLWVFLLIVLGILILIIGTTSCSMHWVQRRRRDRLRRRVASGDVDLEALGIKRLTVPQEVIDKMPLYTYSDGVADAEKTTTTTATTTTSTAISAAPISQPLASPTITVAPGPASLPQLHQLHAAHFSQATCPICLEDYISSSTTVRELPCRHLFHPECVDPFLRQNSSLCPMCKKTVLPTGYCPAVITNVMVRRERMVRRIRERVNTSSPQGSPNLGAIGSDHVANPRVREAVRNAVASGRRVFSAPVRAPATQPSPAVEMRAATNPLNTVSGDDLARPVTAAQDGRACPPSPETTPPADRQSRREWARDRAVTMLGHRRRVQDSEIEAEAASRPVWRRAVGRMWPGFA